MSISRRVDKTNMGHLHNGILLDCQEEENFTVATVWNDLENTILSEVSPLEEDKYHIIALIRGI